MGGRGSPKSHYSKFDAARNTRDALNLQKIVRETGLQPSEKKTGCDKNDCGVNITFLLASCVPELEMAMKKISRATRVRRNAENRRRYACATVRNAPALQPRAYTFQDAGRPRLGAPLFLRLAGDGTKPNLPRSPFPKRHQQPAGHDEPAARVNGRSRRLAEAHLVENLRHEERHRRIDAGQPFALRPVKGCSSLHDSAQHLPHDAGQASAKELSEDVGGQPRITRNTSKTNRAIAISLNSVA